MPPPEKPPQWLEMGDESHGPTIIPKRRSEPQPKPMQIGSAALFIWTAIILTLAVVLLYVVGIVRHVLHSP